ncbi:glycoside hydrolase TIM-barrel-like domain-containing protein [Brevundimonas sp.]|uniref:baseplate multidomain protein megatron n=1 Tax=Brevundimonas sp. TaxID=1871086 RepID=UPI00391DE0D8
MAQVVLGSVGAAVAGPAGRLIGAVAGRALDDALVGALTPAREGPRVDGLRLTSAAEGAGLPFAIGRNRVGGQVIWAAQFRERRLERGGGKGGPAQRDYAYSLSFAVALCEGPVDGVGRIWADNQPMDLTGVSWRLHRGDEGQGPDPLIAAVEGAAPAYRGVAYLVFEDLPLAVWANRPPMISAEVFRRPAGDGADLEGRISGVCLIPGAGEFTLATTPVLRRTGLTTVEAENVHAADGRPDLIVSLEQLEAQCPNLTRVNLVVGWFGDSLEAGACRIRPGVERRDKATEPLDWSVAGETRATAHVVSQVEGRPAYGGTPSDDTVRQAVAELKRRGLEVVLYPFLFMDGDGYPWRGRITADDPTMAAADIAAFFDGPEGFDRFILHHAALAAETGADGLLIGSEMRGLTTSRATDGSYPAVARLQALAAAARAVVGPGPALSYAADWSEYFGHQTADGDRLFHLDPLWADPALDHVAIDWYPPMGDWRDGDDHLDALAGYPGPADPAYLAAQIAGGEGFDWYYADAAARTAQVRTPIVDTGQGEDWVFRPKDLAGWWGNPHHDRVGGGRSPTPTAWVPGMKPVRLTEIGCAAVDRGGNAPNLFQDPKSSESAAPPFSLGGRDDRMQRRLLRALYDSLEDRARNPLSPVYRGPMIAGAEVWCWDARPYPAFPALTEVWADAPQWRTGHWLNGRLTGEAVDLIRAVLRRGGVADEEMLVEAVAEGPTGLVTVRPTRVREALVPLLTAVDARLAERDGKIAVLAADRAEAPLVLDADDRALPASGVVEEVVREPGAPAASVQVRYVDDGNGYQTGAALAVAAVDGPRVTLDMAVSCARPVAAAAAARALAAAAARETLAVSPGPLARLRLEPGDAVRRPDGGLWRVAGLADRDDGPRAELELLEAPAAAVPPPPPVSDPQPPTPEGARPFLAILDLPPQPGSEVDSRPLAAVARSPWRPMAVWAGSDGETLSLRGRVETPATVGRLTAALAPGPIGRWQETGGLEVEIEGAVPESRSAAQVLAGGGLLAVAVADGWELLQYRQAEIVGAGRWRLTGLLRGQLGTEAAVRLGAPAGALVVAPETCTRVGVSLAERGLERLWRAGPDGGAPGPAAAQVSAVWTGVQARPWSPAHLRATATAEGLEIRWVPRVRIGGDGWELEPDDVDGPDRFAVHVLAGGLEVRRFEATARRALYPAADLAPDRAAHGPLTLAVVRYGTGFGWGAPAFLDI